MPECVFIEMKTYLLTLEDLFRSFSGEVKRENIAIENAIQSSFDRNNQDMVRCEQKWIDNPVFSVNKPDQPKGKGKGKDDALGVGVGDPDPDEPEPNEPWYIFQAKMIAKIGHGLQKQLMVKELLQYYNEWCPTPKNAVRGVAYVDVCMGYDVDNGEGQPKSHIKQLNAEKM